MNTHSTSQNSACSKFYNKIISRLYRSIFIFIFTPLLLTGGCIRKIIDDMNPGKGIYNTSHENQNSVTATNKKNNNGSHSTIPPSNQSNPPIFLLLHGLGADSDCFSYLKEELSKAFTGSSFVCPSQKTYSLSIEEQTKESLEKLLATNDVKKRPILLIGHSQGGLRACKLLPECKKKGLDVKGVVALSTPFRGAPILDQEQFLPNLVNLIKDNQNNPFSTLLSPVAEWLKDMYSLINEPGMKDLKPNSNFLSKLTAQLRNETIPILPIAAVMPKLEFPNSIFDLFTPLIVGHSENTNNEHDMIVPVTSQLGEGVLPKASKDLQATPITALHWSIDQSICKDILHSPETVDRVIAFSNDVLRNNH